MSYPVDKWTHPVVDTWDVFDTLVARFGIGHEYIFQLVEETSGLSGFAKLRKSAQSYLDRIGQPYVIHAIYQCLHEQFGVDRLRARQLLALEITAEKEQLLPIRRQITRVRPEDLVVSDMYMGPDFVGDILRGICGFHTMAPPVVGNWGKSRGTIWPVLLEKYTIRCHHGDKLDSDLLVPAQFGIASELIEDHKLVPWETFLRDAGVGHLALVIRELRLRQLPAGADRFHHVVVGPFCTFLLTYALYLRAFAQAKGIRRYVFASRDCDQLSYLFRQLNDAIECENLNLNRALLSNENYDGYFLNHLGQDSTIVDILASGRSLSMFTNRTGIDIPVIVGMLMQRWLSEEEMAERNARFASGRLHSLANIDDYKHHCHGLEVLLESGYPSVLDLGLDAPSGALVRRFAPEDRTTDERARHEFICECVSCLGDLLTRRGDHFDYTLDQLRTVFSKALGECLAAESHALFPTFLARERKR